MIKDKINDILKKWNRRQRDFQFDEINVYYKKDEKLILIPTGELKQFPTNVNIEPAIVIDLPITQENLKHEIEKCFKLCWSTSVEKLTKEPSVIEKVLGYKSYKKVVENYDAITLTYNKVEKNYSILKSIKSKNFRYYEGIEFQYIWNKIDYDFILRLIQEYGVSSQLLYFRSINCGLQRRKQLLAASLSLRNPQKTAPNKQFTSSHK